MDLAILSVDCLSFLHYFPLKLTEFLALDLGAEFVESVFTDMLKRSSTYVVNGENFSPVIETMQWIFLPYLNYQTECFDRISYVMKNIRETFDCAWLIKSTPLDV